MNNKTKKQELGESIVEQLIEKGFINETNRINAVDVVCDCL